MEELEESGMGIGTDGVPGRIFGMGKAGHQRHGHVRAMLRIKLCEDPTERVN